MSDELKPWKVEGDKPKMVMSKKVDAWSPALNGHFDLFDAASDDTAMAISTEGEQRLFELVRLAIENIAGDSLVDLGRYNVVFRCIDTFGRPWVTKFYAGGYRPHDFATLGLLLSRETKIPWEGANFAI